MHIKLTSADVLVLVALVTDHPDGAPGGCEGLRADEKMTS